MDGINLGWTVVVGVPILALHLVSVTLTRALRTYSRSRLEDLCERRGHPGRASDVAHEDERTERSGSPPRPTPRPDRPASRSRSPPTPTTPRTPRPTCPSRPASCSSTPSR
ncbi:MAG: hypothetical protein LC745_04525 [Planctomycetia bacterium]|nr:hypothetical protein [Planctomycetia bacterium]